MRNPGLDRLRAAAMLLGVVLHAGLAYSPHTPPQWPVRDDGAGWVTLVHLAIHTWRMQLFFVLAGFFAAGLIARRGVGGFVRHRARRIALPLVLGMVTIVPLTLLADGFARWWLDPSRASLRDHWLGAVPGSPGVLTPHPAHLWFLWMLVVFCGVAALTARVLTPRAEAVGGAWWTRALTRLDSAGARLSARALSARRGLGVLGLTAAMLPVAALVDGAGVHVGRAGLMSPRMHVYYAVFFAFGLWAYRAAPRLGDLARRVPLHAGLALAAFLLTGLALVWMDPRAARPPAWRGVGFAIGLVSGSLLTWSVIFALLGLAARWQSPAGRLWRVLSDSAYWVYLAHLPAVLALGALLTRVDAAPALKWAACTMLTTAGLVAIWQWPLRHTAIGRLLGAGGAGGGGAGGREAFPGVPAEVMPGGVAPADAGPARAEA